MAASVRRVIYTGAFAGITATGAIYGAQLKTAQEAEEAANKAQASQDDKTISQPSPEETANARQEQQRVEASQTVKRIAALRGQRSELIRQKENLERRMADLHARKATGERSVVRPESGAADGSDTR